MHRLLLSLAFASFAGTASAQTYPERQITLIVPFAAGGTSDIIARIAADEMSQILNQRILIENIGGAGGSTALTRAAAATPDGYTLVIGNAGTNAATYTIHKDLKFSPDSFKPIGMIAKTLPVIALKNGFPASDVKGFIEYANANPGKITLGHAGIGSSNYLICKLFLQAAKVKVELIGYRGAGPALNDAMGGHVDGVCDAATSVASSINGGKVHGLVMAGRKRAEILPQVPTASEAGLPAFTNEGWNALFAPAGTPDAVIARLNETLRKAISSEKVTKRLAELASFPATGEELEPAYVKSFVEAEVKKYRELLAE
ncbi:MAG: tripartite tricarboxylate transporter substrate binding protein BugD [Methylobacterium sp.]|jgi:tripartite-type tricarboxylate transporter receptor subunit TctC|nr:tripartite tricarboxylate transporter substrate binding protein BugD [Methylobacterium sp.]MCA3602185.1 tripartite tricarboxylate transporter substrate binding protein BugD [Methylobacterium sp.]MCA3613253.1 tripartite tricarboxylate transporter substrate binding protein BugD [Methylobacterium sp.]MCA3614962.1 tripartite tricarboxylate transporter substrate binding protein BugD [Methylobacterium sp.]MCA3625594.1 tripartite tricarboxylate transporter substrate binding protein BugD [Methylobac